MNTLYFIDMNLTLNEERPSSNVKVASETVTRHGSIFTYEITYLKDSSWYSFSKTITLPCREQGSEKMELNLRWENGHPRMDSSGIRPEQHQNLGGSND